MGGDIARLWFGMRCGAVRLRFGMRCGTVRLRYGTDEFLGVISWCGTWWEDVTCDYGAEQSEGLVVILRCGTRGHDFMGLRDFHGNFCAKLTAKFLGFDTIPAQSKKIKEADMAKNREISSCVTGTFKKGVRIPRIYLASALALAQSVLQRPETWRGSRRTARPTSAPRTTGMATPVRAMATT